MLRYVEISKRKSGWVVDGRCQKIGQLATDKRLYLGVREAEPVTFSSRSAHDGHDVEQITYGCNRRHMLLGRSKKSVDYFINRASRRDLP
jgi:hypothetical protein